MTASKREEKFLCLSVSPAEIDRLWSQGWRHFGIFFFRYRQSTHRKEIFNVLPLRIELNRFAPSRSQKRVLKINHDVELVVGPTAIDAAKEILFEKHSRRFFDNIPSSLHDFLSPVPDSMPCRNLELCVYKRDRLIGVTFLDLGENATSAVYAIFDPAEATRSLGILMMLHSIRLSQERGYRYYYPGYAYREPFAYDYKKRFTGLEYLDWKSGWKPYPRLRGRE